MVMTTMIDNAFNVSNNNMASVPLVIESIGQGSSSNFTKEEYEN